MGVTLLEKPSLENNSQDGWPVDVDLKVILPGLVFYEDLKNTEGQKVGGTVLIKKEAFDKMANSLKNKPIINWDHRPVDPGEFDKGKFQGIITGPAVFNAVDGWYHAPGVIWNKQTLRNVQNGYSISCAYVPTDMDTRPGTHNKVPYQAEVLDGEYTHIAVVPVPRYEGARIELLNSGGNPMGLLSFFRKDKPEEKVEFDAATAKVALDGGSEVPLTELINSYKAVEAAKAQAPVKCGLEDLIEVDGKKVPVRELLNAHLTQMKNSLESEHKEGDHKGSPKDNCGMCNSAEEDEKKKKAEDERKNAAASAEAVEKKRKEDEELKNTSEKTAKAKAEAEMKRLDELRNKGQKVEMPTIKSLNALMDEGEARYGGKPAVAAK